MSVFEKHRDAISHGVVRKTNVIGIRKAINAIEREPYGNGVTSPKITADEVFELEELLQQRQPLVVGELHETGLTLLRSKRYAKQLERVADLLPGLMAFSLVRFDRFRPHGSLWKSVPVYKATAAGGDHFFFRNIPWQSGGKGPEIVGARETLG